MLDPKSWLDLAKPLAVGEKAMHKHDCGSGSKLLVENKASGYAAWCFRCNEAGFVPHGRPSRAALMDQIGRRRAAEAAVRMTTALPDQPVHNPREWPLAARVWLYKAGLGNDDIAEHGIYYSKELDRVVLPVVQGGEPIYWQARSVTGGIKYLNPNVPDRPLFKVERPNQPDDILVVTEDMLSAMKVGRTFTAWSLLGTRISPAQAVEIAAAGRKVAVWLDPDPAGIKGAHKVLRELRPLGVDAVRVVSSKDPKLHSNDEIKETVLSAWK